MAKIEPNSRFKHADNISWRRVGDEGVILDLESCDYFSLNEVGIFIWEKLGAGASIEQTEAALCEEYEVTPPDARKHLQAFIAKLQKQKLLACR